MTMEQTNKNNIVSLRQYVESLFKAHEKEHVLLSDNTSKADRALEIRLEAMNEFRSQIMSERGHFVTQDKYEAQHQALLLLLDTKIEVLETRSAQLEANLSNLKGRFSAIAAAISIMLVIVEIGLRFLIK
jgi:hypothetical protein